MQDLLIWLGGGLVFLYNFKRGLSATIEELLMLAEYIMADRMIIEVHNDYANAKCDGQL